MIMHTFKSLADDLAAIGIKSADLLTIHISLKAVGEIDTSEMSGAHVVISALREAVHNGLLLVPTHTYEELEKTSYFDVMKSVPCIGTLPRIAAEIAAQAYENGDRSIMRSFHPSHSLAAFGRDAADFTACDTDTVTAMPMNGCYGSLYKNGGRILLIGVDLRRCTFMHLADEYLTRDIPFELRDITAVDHSGTAHKRKWCTTRGSSRKYEQRRPCLKEAGALSFGRFGDADTILVDAKKCFDAVVKYETENRPI